MVVNLDYDTRFGSGWISGVFSVALGIMGLGAVLCLLFPDLLTTPDARGWYPMQVFRFLIHLVLVSAFGLGALSIVLSRRIALGLAGIALALVAVLLGGSQVEVGTLRQPQVFVGLDWFLLNPSSPSSARAGSRTCCTSWSVTCWSRSLFCSRCCRPPPSSGGR